VGEAQGARLSQHLRGIVLVKLTAGRGENA
jgi:hypothetical protein